MDELDRLIERSGKEVIYFHIPQDLMRRIQGDHFAGDMILQAMLMIAEEGGEVVVDRAHILEKVGLCLQKLVQMIPAYQSEDSRSSEDILRATREGANFALYLASVRDEETHDLIFTLTFEEA